MKKAWKIFGTAALVCLLLGVVLIAAAFFMGSSPVVLREHGSLDEYFVRLATNWKVFNADLHSLLG